MGDRATTKKKILKQVHPQGVVLRGTSLSKTRNLHCDGAKAAAQGRGETFKRKKTRHCGRIRPRPTKKRPPSLRRVKVAPAKIPIPDDRRGPVILRAAGGVKRKDIRPCGPLPTPRAKTPLPCEGHKQKRTGSTFWANNTIIGAHPVMPAKKKRERLPPDALGIEGIGPSDRSAVVRLRRRAHLGLPETLCGKCHSATSRSSERTGRPLAVTGGSRSRFQSIQSAAIRKAEPKPRLWARRDLAVAFANASPGRRSAT